MYKFFIRIEDSLEFTLQKDGKRYLKLADTTLSFQVELPANYVPDNQFGHKMFESLELSINHEQISRKSTALDYSMSENFFEKVLYDDSYVMSSMDVFGTYDPMSLDASDKRVATRVSKGEYFTEVRVHNNESYDIPMYRWYLIMSLNHGLARVPDCLPADVTVNFRFQRAPAEFAVLKISDNIAAIKKSDNKEYDLPLSYQDSVIPLKYPLLNAYYAYSGELEATMSKMRNSNLEINFMGKELF